MKNPKYLKFLLPTIIVLIVVWVGLVVFRGSGSPKTPEAPKASVLRSTQGVGELTKSQTQEPPLMEFTPTMIAIETTVQELNPTPLSSNSIFPILTQVQTRVVFPTSRIATSTQWPTQVTNPTAVQPTSPQALTITPTPTHTQTATKANTPTFTQASQSGWDGEWVIYKQQEDGSIQSGTLKIATSGTQVNALSTINGNELTLTGTIRQGSQQVGGFFTQNAINVSFLWLMKSENQWVGNTNNTLAFCASRQGVPIPEPCGYFEPS